MNFARHQARDERRAAGHQNDFCVDGVLVEESPFLRDPEAEGAAGNRRSADIDMHRLNRPGGLPRAKQSDKQKCVGNLADKRSFVATHPALLMPLLMGKCKLTHAPFSSLHRAAGPPALLRGSSINNRPMHQRQLLSAPCLCSVVAKVLQRALT